MLWGEFSYQLLLKVEVRGRVDVPTISLRFEGPPTVRSVNQVLVCESSHVLSQNEEPIGQIAISSVYIVVIYYAVFQSTTLTPQEMNRRAKNRKRIILKAAKES